MKTALITGITGQDGSFLAEFLLEKGYDVHGTIRRSSVDFRERIAHLEGHPNFHLHYADLGDSMSIIQVLNKVKPDEVYNLAAQSHVQGGDDDSEFQVSLDVSRAFVDVLDGSVCDDERMLLAEFLTGVLERLDSFRYGSVVLVQICVREQVAEERFSALVRCGISRSQV